MPPMSAAWSFCRTESVSNSCLRRHCGVVCDSPSALSQSSARNEEPALPSFSLQHPLAHVFLFSPLGLGALRETGNADSKTGVLAPRSGRRAPRHPELFVLCCSYTRWLETAFVASSQLRFTCVVDIPCVGKVWKDRPRGGAFSR